MATSPVEICNSALARLGTDRITSLDDDSARARAMNEQYDNTRKSLLRGHPWNFAKKRIQLAQLVDSPLFGWDNYYQLPSDCLRVLEIDDDKAEWEIEGRYLATDNDTIEIKYISDIEDTTLFDPHFEEAFAAELAFNLSYYFNQSVSARESLKTEAKEKLATARSFNAQEGSLRSVDSGTFRDVRF